ncbi:MAG: hypothetical protein AAFY48_14555 [Bacteroidota bacterium]
MRIIILLSLLVALCSCENKNQRTTAPEQGVQCWSLPNDVFSNTSIGDTLSFIGFSYGQGADLSDPVIAFKRLE